MKHTIEIEDLQSWIEDSPALIFASASGINIGRKTLEAGMDGNFKVTHKGKVVWQGIEPITAVEKYNEI